MFAQRVVDAVCKTKENISARLSLRAIRLRAPRYLSAQLRPLAFLNITPPKKKQIIKF